MPYLEEYDLDCTKRKWQDSFAKLENDSYRYIDDINHDFEFFDYAGVKVARPVYHLFESGYYKFRDTWACLIRTNHKTFKVGLSPDVHALFYYKNGMWAPGSIGRTVCNIISWDVLWSPQTSLESFGPLSRKIFLSEANVFYLTRKIGYRKKNKITLENKHLIQELRDLTRHLTIEGESCQISAL